MTDWDPKAFEMYYEISTEMRQDGKTKWIVARLIVNGMVGGEGECPDIPPYSRDGVSEKTAISRAQFDFDRKVAACPRVHKNEPSMRITHASTTSEQRQERQDSNQRSVGMGQNETSWDVTWLRSLRPPAS